MRYFQVCVLATFASLTFANAAAQNPVALSVRAIPAEIAPGQNAFIEVSGTFPDSCTFGEGELGFAVNVVADNEVQVIYTAPEPDQACGEALTNDVRVFGPIPFETTGPDVAEMTVTFDWSRGDLAGFGETAVSITDEPAVTMPETGTWWSPDHPGHGLSIQAQGNAIFAVAYSYDEDGASQWATTQGAVTGGLFTDTWRQFEGGNCWLCDSPYAAPSRVDDERVAHLAIDGNARVYLRIGDAPGEAIALQRFHLLAATATDVDNRTLTLPDLTGQWAYIPATNQRDPRVLTFSSEVVDEAEVVLSYISREDFGTRLRCTQPGASDPVECFVNACVDCSPPPRWPVTPSNIGQDRITLPDLGGTFIRIGGEMAGGETQ